MTRSGLISVCLFLALMVGCEKSGPTTPQASGDSGAAQEQAGTAAGAADGQAAAPAVEANAPPQQIVSVFLESLRAGDEKTATGLLTDVAREETAKRDLAPQPPGTPHAKYEVKSVEFVTPNKDGAHVNSVWTESDGEGHSTSYEIIWVLRQQHNGWRIAGMATQIAEGQMPMFLNFEDPDDMIRKLQQADEEIAQRNEEEIRQATKPEAPGAAATLPR